MGIPAHMRPYLRFAPTIALLFGLVFDIFTLDKPDALFENVIIISYLSLSALIMTILQSNFGVATEGRRLFLLSVLQFSFGNLASALMVLYARSGTFAGTAIFVGILALLLIGNEVFRNRYARTHLRILIWFGLLLTYCTLIVPVHLGIIGPIAFTLSVLLALGVVSLFAWILLRLTYDEEHPYEGKKVFTSIGMVAVGFIGLYAAHLIPPVPLALKHVGIYHSIERTPRAFVATYERPAWYQLWSETSPTVHLQSGATLFCFSSIYAPEKLQASVQHAWEYYDEKHDYWVRAAEIPFALAGGRDGGFRGYTQTEQAAPGTWRCNVETLRGTLIGRTTFTVIEGVPELETTNL